MTVMWEKRLQVQYSASKTISLWNGQQQVMREKRLQVQYCAVNKASMTGDEGIHCSIVL